jgi:hypothetical protein
MYQHFVLEETSLKKKAESFPETQSTLFQYTRWKSPESVNSNGIEFNNQRTVYRNILLQ